jgi:MoaA/NifB/PqqE/SkfB family radical SAM enzyme
MSIDKLSIFPREEEYKNSKEYRSSVTTVNEAQYSFGPRDIQNKFERSQFKDKETYQEFLEYRKEWYKRALSYDPGKQPLSINCELVSTCNLGCSMCYTITEDFQSSVVGATRMLPWKVVKKIIDESYEIGVKSISFSWRGESTLYKVRDENDKIITFTDVLKYARDKNILEVTCLTHGQLIDNEMAQKIVDAEPNWINFSIDGLEKEYNKIRTPKNKKDDNKYNAFKVVCENIKNLVKIRDQKKKTRPQIRTNCIFPSIYKNPNEYKDYMYSIGVDWVTVNEILDFRDGDVLENELKEKWSCQYPFQRLTISANGVIMPCTGSHNEESGLTLGRYIGSPNKIIIKDTKKINVDLPEMSLLQAWNCEKLNLIRDKHKNNEWKQIKEGCRNCRHAMKKNGVTYVPKEWNIDTMKWENHTWRNG